MAKAHRYHDEPQSEGDLSLAVTIEDHQRLRDWIVKTVSDYWTDARRHVLSAIIVTSARRAYDLHPPPVLSWAGTPRPDDR